MKNNSLILIGAGGHAKSCIDVIEQEGKYKIVGLVGLEKELGLTVNGYDVTGTDSELSNLAKKSAFAIIAIGQIHSPNLRIKLLNKAIGAGFKIASSISPFAYISPYAEIGPGTIVMHGVVINSGVRIGSNCIINSRALIEHDVNISNNCHISTGALINGNVSIGEGSFIGSGSVIKEGVSVGDNSIVKMSSSVLSDLPNISKKNGETL